MTKREVSMIRLALLVTSKLKIHSVVKVIPSKALVASQVAVKEVASAASNKVVSAIFLNSLRRCLVVVRREAATLEMEGRCKVLKALTLR